MVRLILDNGGINALARDPNGTAIPIVGLPDTMDLDTIIDSQSKTLAGAADVLFGIDSATAPAAVVALIQGGVYMLTSIDALPGTPTAQWIQVVVTNTNADPSAGQILRAAVWSFSQYGPLTIRLIAGQTGIWVKNLMATALDIKCTRLE